jgi:hypothetical protein
VLIDLRTPCYSPCIPMVQSPGQASRLAFLLLQVLLVFAVVLFPVMLSNNGTATISVLLFFILVFFFVGYLLVNLLGMLEGPLRALISPVLGVVTVTTAFDLVARTSIAIYFPYLVVAVATAGIVRFVLDARQRTTLSAPNSNEHAAFIAGTIVALSVAPLYWRSGRFSGGDFVFYGPAGQDPLFHVTLFQRLLQHVPPDNFIFSGLRAPVYHYFDDLTLALIMRSKSALHLGSTDIFDLYYRCYPTFVYFLLGTLAFSVGRRLVGTTRGGILGVVLLLGGGGLGWVLGILQTASHASQFAAMRASVFSSWTTWDGVDAILPLVHRPAHYHGLLICLAALVVLLRPERLRRDWLVAGLLLGLMAGFNFTLAAIIGVATVLASITFYLQHRRNEAHDLAWLALFIFVGSVPVIATMLFFGFHDPSAGFPFRGPNLEFSTAMWGSLLDRFMPAVAIPWAALTMFPILAYGIKLSGLGALGRLDLGDERHRGIAMVLAMVFVFSFVIGTFFPYNALGGIAVIFIQPTLWILGLFSLRPIHSWLERNRGSLQPFILWSVLGVTWAQALLSFNFSHKLAFDGDTARVLADIRSVAAPDEVVAYLPSNVTERAIWGHPGESTNFATMALTGLDGYFSSETYSTAFAVPGLSGRNPADVLAQATHLYEQRSDNIQSFVKGNINEPGFAYLRRDHVCWIVVAGRALQQVSSLAAPWRKTRDLAVYSLCR